MQKQTIGCVKAATAVLGDKWTPQLLRFFANEPAVRFGSIQDFVEGINPRTLSARLGNLEQEGVIQKITKPNTTRCEYCLTEKGKALIPILTAMETWSRTYES
ncbi:helix-turn-helix transcriptional regulator [Candidatus Saccharibacteria bacterium TM7i]|nr:helix-turn-helix transcriptional regulator [Candidatus Saccharibacteria bacterium TM7i]